MLGKKHTKEAKEKMSESHKGYKHTLKARHNMGEARRGSKHPHSEETKRKLSEIHKGVKLSKEHRKAISRGLKGRIPSLKGEDYLCHHRDGNHFNDDQSNLRAMTMREHSRLHASLCNGLIGKNRR